MAHPAADVSEGCFGPATFYLTTTFTNRPGT